MSKKKSRYKDYIVTETCRYRIRARSEDEAERKFLERENPATDGFIGILERTIHREDEE
jgi:hypothetical protein